MPGAVAAARTGGGKQAPLRLFALRGFGVWHREQFVTVPAGEVEDPALVATLRSIDDPALLEWRQ